MFHLKRSTIPYKCDWELYHIPFLPNSLRYQNNKVVKAASFTTSKGLSWLCPPIFKGRPNSGVNCGHIAPVDHFAIVNIDHTTPDKEMISVFPARFRWIRLRCFPFPRPRTLNFRVKRGSLYHVKDIENLDEDWLSTGFDATVIVNGGRCPWSKLHCPELLPKFLFCRLERWRLFSAALSFLHLHLCPILVFFLLLYFSFLRFKEALNSFSLHTLLTLSWLALILCEFSISVLLTVIESL